MSQAVAKFISVVGIHFPPPRAASDDDHSAWVASMVRNLRSYDDDVLAAAAQEIIDTRTIKDGRFFPLPAECRAVCTRHARLALERRERKTPLLSSDGRDPSPFAGWRYALADDLMKTETGKQAAREGWALAFHDFCREKGKAPSGPEIAQCKASSRGFEDAYEQAVRNAHAAAEPSNLIGVILAKSLVGLGDSMRARCGELRDRVLGRSA